MKGHDHALLAALQDTHREWRIALSEALECARMPETGVWERWAAVRYLIEEFEPRFARETRALTTAAEQLPAGKLGHVWALGELLQLLCHHLGELGPMAQFGPAFADTTNKLLRAFDFWCTEVETGVGVAVAEGLAPATMRELESLLADAAVQGAVPA